MLVDDLIRTGYLKTPRIIRAFRAVKRADFLSPMPDFSDHQSLVADQLAELDQALPIGFGQTISQPSVVAFMLELLDPRPGHKILDVGAGSGWTSTLLASIVFRGKNKGLVIAVERVPALCSFGKSNIAKYEFIKKGAVRYELGDGRIGFPEEAPFDRILASAAGDALSESWKEQIRTGGIIVAPLGNSIWKFTKSSDGSMLAVEYPGFAFVPLV